MAVDELAQRRATNARRLAGARRHPPQPMPGDVDVIIEDLRRMRDMAEEVMAEAVALNHPDVTVGVGALILHLTDVVSTAERVREEGD